MNSGNLPQHPINKIGKPSDIEIAGGGKVWVSYLATIENEAGVEVYDGHTWKNVLIGQGTPEDNVRSLAVTPAPPFIYIRQNLV